LLGRLIYFRPLTTKLMVLAMSVHFRKAKASL